METTKERALGAYLKALRETRGLTQKQAAELAGTSGAYIAQLEGGRRKRPSWEMLTRLARAYDVEEDVLLREAGYLSGGRIGVAPERILWAFQAVQNDPDFVYGSRMRSGDLSLESMGFLVEIYERLTGRRLLTPTEAQANHVAFRQRAVLDPVLDDLFFGLLELAKTRLRQVAPLSTVFLVGVILEAHLRKLAVKHGLATRTRSGPRHWVDIVDKLQEVGAIAEEDGRQIKRWLDFRVTMWKAGREPEDYLTKDMIDFALGDTNDSLIATTERVISLYPA